MLKADLARDRQAEGYQVEVRAAASTVLRASWAWISGSGAELIETAMAAVSPSTFAKTSTTSSPAPSTTSRSSPVAGADLRPRRQAAFRLAHVARCLTCRALETARSGRLTQERLNVLHQSTEAQRQWHRNLPERLPNERVSPDTARHLLEGRRSLQVEEGVQRRHNKVGGHRAVRPTLTAAGVLGTAYGALEAKDQVNAAIDTAPSTREQWVRGGEETVNQASKAVVTGAAATVGAIPGVAVGTLTSPVTGPVGPVVGERPEIHSAL